MTAEYPPVTTDYQSPAMEESLRAALADRTRPTRPNALSASLTFAWRAMLKIRHVPEQLFDVTAFPIMFTLMFTYLFGGALAGSPKEYLQFLLPGVLVQTILMITIYTGTTLNNDIKKGVFDRFRSLPIWRPSFLVGALLADTVRYTMASTVVIALGLILGFRPDGGIAGVVVSIALLLVFAFSMSWVWTSLALVMRTPESLMAVSMMVLFPLTFVSNVFVDPATMPGWLQTVVDLNPVTHLTNAVRAMMDGNGPGKDLTWIMLESVGLVVIFGPLTVYLYNKK